MKVAKDSIRMLLEQKLLYNPRHDFGLVLFGSSETGNALNDSMGGKDYKNVVVERSLGPIDLEFFRDIQKIKAGAEPQQHGDIMDALIVGLDMLHRFIGPSGIR